METVSNQPSSGTRKKKIVIITIVIVVLAVAGVWFGIRLGKPLDASLSKYSAVYLSSGDIYFGELSRFPYLRLRNVWFLQRGQDGQSQPQFAVAPLKRAFWGPADEISLNSRQVLFSTRLRADSPVVKAIDGGFGEPPAAALPPAPAHQNTPSSTPKDAAESKQ